MPSVEIVTRRLLQTASAEVETTEDDALGEDPAGVHRHRKRVRRMRAVLAATARVADDSDITPVRASLAEWGRQLGEVRDAEARATLAGDLLSEVGGADADARRRLVGDERAHAERLRARLRELAETHRTQRRRQLVRECGLTLRIDEPDAPAAAVYADVLRREARRVRRAAKRADGSLENLHELRKAGRRLRYVAEAVDAAAPGMLGDAPRRLARAGSRVHRALGDHRDLELLAARAEALRVRAFRAQEATAPYDAVAAASRRRAERSLARAPKAARRVRKAAKKLP